MSSLDHSYFKGFMEDLNSLNDELFLSDIDDSRSKENFYKANVDMKIKSLNFSNQSIRNMRYSFEYSSMMYILYLSFYTFIKYSVFFFSLLVLSLPQENQILTP